MGNIFTDEVRAGQTSIIDQFNIFYKQKNLRSTLQKYEKKIELEYEKKPHISLYPLEKYENYKTNILYTEFLPLKISQKIASKIFISWEIIKKLVKIFIIIGSFHLLFIRLKKRKKDTEYVIMVLVGFFCLVAVMILPFASIQYDLLRTYQQILIILSLPAVLGGLIIFKFLRKRYAIISEIGRAHV